jgi:hypothetical protein
MGTAERTGAPVADIVEALMAPRMYDSSHTDYTWDRGDLPAIKFTFRVMPDDWTTIDEYEDVYGKLCAVERHPYRYGCNADRPEGFDGSAEIIRFGRSNDGFWWQPPADIAHDPVERKRLRQSVIDIVEHGFVEWNVDLFRQCGSCDQWELVGWSSWTGMFPFQEPDSSDVENVVCEALDNVGASLWEDN